MSSSEQFPSGLNKWTSSDKPVRQDFVDDNRLLDESAMWKTNYDMDGAIAQVGGIDNYAMSKAAYDPESIVGDAGDIASFVRSEAYGYTKGYARATAKINADTNELEITSEIEHDEEWYEVQFVAIEDYMVTRAYKIDGVQVNIKTINGTDVAGHVWKNGAVVSLLRRGDNAYLRGTGSGVRLNYEVIRVANTQELPQEPAENTIAVVTEKTIAQDIFTLARPDLVLAGHADGTVGIHNVAGGVYPFSAYSNATHNMQVALGRLYQYDAATNSSIKRDAYIYQANTWHKFSDASLIVYDSASPNAHLNVTGVWLNRSFAGGYSQSGAGIDAQGRLYVWAVFNQVGSSIGLLNPTLPIDMTDYKLLRVTYQYTGASPGFIGFRNINTAPTAAYVPPPGVVWSKELPYSAAPVTVEYDITNVNGALYFAMYAGSYNRREFCVSWIEFI